MLQFYLLSKKPDKHKNQYIREKTGEQNMVKEIKQIHTEDGHKQTTKTNTTI